MPLVQHLKTGETCEVSTEFIESSEVLQLMFEDTIPEEDDEPLPLNIDIKAVKALNLILEKLKSVKLVIREGIETNLMDFIKNNYSQFISDYVIPNEPSGMYIEDLNRIVESVSVEDVSASFYATNFLDCPVLMRGVAYLLGFMITKTSYDTKFRVFNAMRFRLGHLTSKKQVYQPTEPIERGWEHFIDLMEPYSLAVPREVIEIINDTASYKVNDVYIKDLETDVFMKFGAGAGNRNYFNNGLRIVHGGCDGHKCFNSTWIKSNGGSEDDSDVDIDLAEEEQLEYSRDDIHDIKKKLRLEKQALIENISFLETTNVCCLRNFFKDCDKFNLPLLWNVSNVVDFKGVFLGATNFNQSLPWNTRNARNMALMFGSAKKFNQPLKWSTRNVSKMSAMFFRNLEFNSPIEFDTRNLELADSMFAEAPKFNQPINFNTRNLKYCDSMFREAKEFNQVVDWDTPKLLKVSNVFDGAISFNQKVPWDTRNVKDFTCAFRNAKSFNQPVDWDFSRATMTNNMFRGAELFNYPIQSSSPKLVSMDGMFRRATNFNSVVELDTSRVSMMREVFAQATSFNQPLDTWKFNKAYCMSNMFLEATSFSYRLPFDHTRVKFPCDLFN